MPVGARQLTLLGEFRPFGLVAEALNGKPPDDSHDKYHYFLFDPDVVREGDEKDDNNTSGSSLSRLSDHDLFYQRQRVWYSFFCTTIGSMVEQVSNGTAIVHDFCL